MARVIDKGAHRVGHEFLTRIRTEERLEGFDLLEGGIEPLVIRHGSENDRHPIVDRGHEVIRLCRDDRTGLKRLPFGERPVFPQSRKGKRTRAL